MLKYYYVSGDARKEISKTIAFRIAFIKNVPIELFKSHLKKNSIYKFTDDSAIETKEV